LLGDGWRRSKKRHQLGHHWKKRVRTANSKIQPSSMLSCLPAANVLILKQGIARRSYARAKAGYLFKLRQIQISGTTQGIALKYNDFTLLQRAITDLNVATKTIHGISKHTILFRTPARVHRAQSISALLRLKVLQ
jgi:hypothetical protein